MAKSCVAVFGWLALLLLLQSCVAEPAIKQVLLTWKDKVLACNATSSELFATWRADRNLVNWTGLTVDNTTLTLTGIVLENAALCGQLPTSFSVLTSLTSLVLSHNDMKGPLPTEWSRLKNLQKLHLGDNSLSGTLPHTWSALLALTQLAVFSNVIQGALPPVWGGGLPSLLEMDMGHNNFTGTLPLEWTGLRALTLLFVHESNLSGTLPPVWGKMKGLRMLFLQNNSLAGTLPGLWSGLQGVTQLLLHHNFFTGPLPSAWAQMIGLKDLVITNNPLRSTLPAAWSQLTQLVGLTLNYCQLQGPLPVEWSALKSLSYLDVSHNFLTGTLPVKWSQLEPLQFMFLWNNSFAGTIPPAWGQFTNMIVLSLVKNALTGPIPPAWSRLQNLTQLYLTHNRLTGTLPPEWSRLASATRIILSNNTLNGTLPLAWSEMPELQQLFVDRNQFTGTFPSQWTQVSYLMLGQNRLVGSLPPVGWWNTTRPFFFDVAGNNLTGTLPAILNDNLHYLNASHNSLSGPIPPLPDAMLYLHLSHNWLQGKIPDIGSHSNLTFLDLSNNRLDGLPDVFQGPTARYLNLADNALQGTLPDSGWRGHALRYCDIGRNNLSGDIPDSWTAHDWVYLALDNNSLSGDLTHKAWKGHVAVVLLHSNGFTGCLPLDWPYNSSVRLLSFADNAINCLPASWGAPSGSFQNLSLLSAAGDTVMQTIPLSWVEYGVFKQDGKDNVTVLQLGPSWLYTARRNRDWRKAVCIKPDLNQKLVYTTKDLEAVSAEVQRDVESLTGQELKSLSSFQQQQLQAEWLKDTLFFAINQGPLRLPQVQQVTPNEICQNRDTKLIVALQWGIVFGAVAVMAVLYYCEARYQVLSRLVRWVTNQRFPRRLAPPSEGRAIPQAQALQLTAGVKLAVTTGHHVRFLVMLVLYWYDVISDLVVIRQVWGFWPGYTLLFIFLLNYVAGWLILVWKLKVKSGVRWLVLILGLPAMPLIDTVTFMLLALPQSMLQRHPRVSQSLVQWDALFEMRDLVEVVIESLPSSVLQSIVFVAGNQPRTGLFLDLQAYLVSSTASCLKMILFVAMLLHKSLRNGISPWACLTQILTLKHATDGLVTGHPSPPSADGLSKEEIEYGMSEL